MCNFFSGVILKDGKIRFANAKIDNDGVFQHSHEDVIRLLKLRDTETGTERAFLRFERTEGGYNLDETRELPEWYEMEKENFVKRIEKLYKKAYPALAQYKKVTAQALAQYKKVTAQALAQYEKATAPALAQYEKATAPAWAQYKKVKAQALENLNKSLSKLPGFVKGA